MTKKKAGMFGIIIAIIIAVCLGTILMPWHRSRTLAKNLELGERYLLEQDYEAAILAFTKAIEIDPKCANAYIKIADAYIGLGDYDSAIEQLEIGYAETGDERVHQALLKIRPEISVDGTRLLQELYALMQAGEYQQVHDYMGQKFSEFSDVYFNQMEGRLALFDGEAFRGEIDGTGLVFKVIDAKNMLAFYGEFQDGVPHGKNEMVFWADLERGTGGVYDRLNWKNGKADGEGYSESLGNIPGAFLKEISEGIFTQDLLNGTITFIDPDVIYRVVVRDGHEAIDGAVYDENTGEYFLAGEGKEDSYHFIDTEYTVWRNLWDYYMSAQTAPEVESTSQAASSEPEQQTPVTEEMLRSKLSAYDSEPILNFIYDDFDQNGTFEAVAFCGSYDEFDGSYFGTLYLVTESEVRVIREKGGYWNSGRVYDFGDAKVISITQYFTTGGIAYFYQVDGDTVREMAGSGVGGTLEQDAEGRFCMEDSQYDLGVDGTGHTWNVYYFYWDDGLKEYGGTEISTDELLKYGGASDILERITADGKSITSIYRRQNGMIHINCTDGSSNHNVRLIVDGNQVYASPVLEVELYDEGIIKPALIPEIAVYGA